MTDAGTATPARLRRATAAADPWSGGDLTSRAEYGREAPCRGGPARRTALKGRSSAGLTRAGLAIMGAARGGDGPPLLQLPPLPPTPRDDPSGGAADAPERRSARSPGGSSSSCSGGDAPEGSEASVSGAPSRAACRSAEDLLGGGSGVEGADRAIGGAGAPASKPAPEIHGDGGAVAASDPPLSIDTPSRGALASAAGGSAKAASG